MRESPFTCFVGTILAAPGVILANVAPSVYAQATITPIRVRHSLPVTEQSTGRPRRPAAVILYTAPRSVSRGLLPTEHRVVARLFSYFVECFITM